MRILFLYETSSGLDILMIEHAFCFGGSGGIFHFFAKKYLIYYRPNISIDYSQLIVRTLGKFENQASDITFKNFCHI